MRNVSFDNPWLLLIAVPLLLAVILPYAWAIRKENRNKAIVTTLILHILIVCIIALAVAGTILTTYMTKTEVVFVADVSYSAQRNLDEVDEHIKKVSSDLPFNTDVGLVCFAKEPELVTPIGGKMVSVKESKVDNSATDISSALDYAAKLFSKDAIKHIVLITDGRETGPEAAAALVRSIEALYVANIYIDAIFVDNNIKEGETEVQVSGVTASAATYLNHFTEVTANIQTATTMQATISLYKNGELYMKDYRELNNGYNLVRFTLDTSSVGVFDYEVRVEAEGDISPYNNTYGFTQEVTGDLHVLLLTNDAADVATVQRLYGENAIIDSYVNQKHVPCTVEEFAKYDEIVLSGIDVGALENASAFVDSLDKAVSIFGKSLVNLGNGKIQDGTTEAAKDYESMLPVKYGNSAQDPKLYAIVLDTSRSMFSAMKFDYAKRVACKLVDILDGDDLVMIVAFSGEPRLVAEVQSAGNKDALKRIINGLTVSQGTVMGAAMEQAYQMMVNMPYENKQVMLVSDGLSYTLGEDDPVDVANKMLNNGIMVSTVNIGTKDETGVATMNDIATVGGGTYHFVGAPADIDEVIYGEVLPDLGETVIEEETKVNINAGNMSDSVLNNVGTSLPNIMGFVQCRAKSDAVTVLNVPYQKDNGVVVSIPLYAYWTYGNGRVACFTSDMLGEWTASWVGNEGEQFLANVMSTNIPVERVDYPYTMNVEYDGIDSLIELVPASINPFATMRVVITMPDGSQVEQTLNFDKTRYYYEFETPEIGKYQIDISYIHGDVTYDSSAVFHLARSPEYDSFAICSAGSLNSAIRDRGTVYEDDSLKVENDEDEISTYTVDFTIPLLAIAIALYLIDICVRKLKWADIRGLFKKTVKTTAKGG